MRESPRFRGRVGAVKLPSVVETQDAGATLPQANSRCVRELAQPALAEAKKKIPADVAQPANQACARPIDFGRRAPPNGRQRSGFAETAFVSLLRGVIVRMRDHGLRAINDSLTLGAAPARILVIFRILHFLEKTATGPNVFAQTA